MATSKFQEPVVPTSTPTPTSTTQSNTDPIGRAFESIAAKLPAGANPFSQQSILSLEAQTIITQEDAFGNVMTKTARWFQLQKQTIAKYPRMASVAEGRLLNEYVDYLQVGPVNEGTLLDLATRYKVDVNQIASSGGFGGGGGGSAEQRRNKIQSLSARIQNDSSKLGVKLGNDAIVYMATVAEKLDYSEDQLTDMIVNQIDWTKVEAGTLTATRDQIKSMGKKYLMNLSDTTAQDYSKRIASGELDTNAISSILAAQARSSMPWIGQYLDQGLTPEDVLTPSRDAIAQGLEINAGDVDITDAKYLKMMTVQDEKLGTRLATQSEVQKNVRTDTRWGQTKQAKQLGSSMATTIAQIFGRSSF